MSCTFRPLRLEDVSMASSPARLARTEREELTPVNHQLVVLDDNVRKVGLARVAQKGKKAKAVKEVVDVTRPSWKRLLQHAAEQTRQHEVCSWAVNGASNLAWSRGYLDNRAWTEQNLARDFATLVRPHFGCTGLRGVMFGVRMRAPQGEHHKPTAVMFGSHHDDVERGARRGFIASSYRIHAERCTNIPRACKHKRTLTWTCWRTHVAKRWEDRPFS